MKESKNIFHIYIYIIQGLLKIYLNFFYYVSVFRLFYLNLVSYLKQILYFIFKKIQEYKINCYNSMVIQF